MSASTPATSSDHRADELVQRVRALGRPDHRTLLGITGPPGAGKSTFAEALVERLGESARLVGMDGFHLSRTQLANLGRLGRMGAIDTFDATGFVALVKRLRNAEGEVVYAPEFRRDREESISGAVAIQPTVQFVVLEGNYLLADQEPWNELGQLFDSVWYCDCDDGTRVSRLIDRHRGSGKTDEEARRWAIGPDQRNAEQVEAMRDRADLIVNLDDDHSEEPAGR